MERVTVPVAGRSYDVTIGTGVVSDAAAHLPDLAPATRAFIVADQAVAPVWLPPLEASLSTRGLHAVPLAVPSGEAAKTLQVYGNLLHQLASQEAHRDDVVVALLVGVCLGRNAEQVVVKRRAHIQCDRVEAGKVENRSKESHT